MKSSHDDQFSDELVESILKSKYSFNEITKDILLNEYADCYVTKAWVSYESTGWGEYCIEAIGKLHEEIWKHDDRGWGVEKIKIKDIKDSLTEIIKQLRNYQP